MKISQKPPFFMGDSSGRHQNQSQISAPSAPSVPQLVPVGPSFIAIAPLPILATDVALIPGYPMDATKAIFHGSSIALS